MLDKKISRLEKSKSKTTLINSIEKIKIKKAKQKQAKDKLLTKKEKILLGLIKTKLKSKS